MKTILDYDAKTAKEILIQPKNYCNFDLPEYFTFESILQKVSLKIGIKSLDMFQKTNPGKLESVNHTILSNKNGELSWRPFELIHPVLYVGLVNLITDEVNWKLLKARFKKFKKTHYLCESIPQISEDKESNRATQIKRWWEKVEQESIKLGLIYQYVFQADMSNCYGSIYTHSISWALHSKSASKVNIGNNKLLGNNIDKFIQKMRYNQTNGIPQGSMLMDLIAEIILGYIDEQLLLELKKNKIKLLDYKILRYRDDYKIFTNKPEVGKTILRELSQVCSSLGISLNSSKTKSDDDPISSSIKADKIDELFIPVKDNKNFAKWLLLIYSAMLKHPNTGTVARQLNNFHDELLNFKESGGKLGFYEKPDVMISMIVNLAIRNPKYYNWCMAILSILIDYCAISKRNKIIQNIINRFECVPNTGMLDIWLQRISSKIDLKIKYSEPLTMLISNPHSINHIWDSSWLNNDLKKIVNSTKIVDFKKLKKMSIIIDRDEVSLFRHEYVV